MKIRARNLIQKLKDDTEALAMPRGRRVGQPGHEVALSCLKQRLAGLKLLPFAGDEFDLTYEAKHPTTGEIQKYTNLVGVVPGKNRELDPILIGAHYDSVIDAPCADDNATSVAMTLALAEEFLGGTLERDLIVVLFDAEEPPHFLSESMGSTRFYKDWCEEIRFAGAIISDLIGHDFDLDDMGVDVPGLGLLRSRANKTVFLLGAESDPAFPGIIEEASHAYGGGIKVFPTLNSYVGSLSDHHIFERNQQPFLFLSCGQGRYYHDERDDLQWINFPKLASITEFTAGLISGIERKADGVECSEQQLVDFEIAMIKRAVGPALPLLMKLFSAKIPRNRSEMDQLMEMLVWGMAKGVVG